MRLSFFAVMGALREAIPAQYFPRYEDLYGILLMDYLYDTGRNLHRSMLCRWHRGQAIPSSDIIGYYIVPGSDVDLAKIIREWILLYITDPRLLMWRLRIMADNDDTLSSHQREWILSCCLDNDPSADALCMGIARSIILSMARYPDEADCIPAQAA